AVADAISDEKRLDPDDAVKLAHANAWLLASGHLSATDQGSFQLTGDCLWPDIDTLMGMLVETCPDASVELQSVLACLVEAKDHRLEPLPELSSEIVTLLRNDACPAIGRLLVVGAIDAAIATAALLRAELVCLAFATPDALSLAKAKLSGLSDLRFVTLDALANESPFDVVIGSAISHSQTPLKPLIDALAPHGQIVLAEETADLFAIMTGRQTLSDAPQDLLRKLRDLNCNVSLAQLTNNAAIELITGRRSTLNTPRQKTSFDAESIVKIIDTAENPADFPAIFRRLPATSGPLWIIVEGTARFAELTGWRRSFVNETGRDIRILVHPSQSPLKSFEHLLTSRETEIILTPTGPRSPRLSALRDQPSGHLRLTAQTRGFSGGGLAWTPIPIKPLADDQVEIEIHATGLNFRDIMWSRGVLPAEALENGFLGPCVGMECAGIITQAGSASGFAPGDNVIAFAAHSLAHRVTTSAKTVIKVPEHVDLAALAALPVIYLTADYALNDVAHLQPGERVLIHGAAGGVGFAAIKLAQHIGAEIFASAGTPEKRRYLKSLGVEHVLDSRSFDFEQAIMRTTGGNGVDVVLNSLFGEAMERSLNCLAPFGRFIELGKRDFYENNVIGLRAMRKNISYHGVDVDQLMAARPATAATLNARVKAAIAESVIAPPPIRRFPAANVEDAFLMMQRSAHIGKIVIDAPLPPDRMAVTVAKPIRGTWLITGGTRGFGLETALWLADQGVETLILVSRSGQISDTAKAALQKSGARFTIHHADLADQSECERMFADIKAQGALNGVVHAAATFADALFADLTGAQIASVIGSKLKAAQTLDRLTQAMDLDHFWLFSSVAARFGNPAQSAYSAANRGLESLAAMRKHQGRAALAIAWGPISDAGYLSRRDTLRDHIATHLTLMTTAQALAQLKHVLVSGHDRAAITIAPDDWARIPGNLPVLSEPLFERLNTETRDSTQSKVDFAALIASEGLPKARQTLVAAMVDETARIMLCAPSDIDARRPLGQLGFDSLMAMNLRIAVEEKFGLQIPVMALAEDVTLTSLATRILDGVTRHATDDETIAEMSSRHLGVDGLSHETVAKIAETVRKAEAQ
ncbi:MAG: type I polyketide synthase, partial [Deltaproteobacteria bacterium]